MLPTTILGTRNTAMNKKAKAKQNKTKTKTNQKKKKTERKKDKALCLLELTFISMAISNSKQNKPILELNTFKFFIFILEAGSIL